MGFVDKIKDAIYADPDEDNTQEQLELSKKEAEAISPYEPGKNKSTISYGADICLFEPRNFDEAENIGTHIKSKKACCVNLRRIPSDYKQRIIDFLSGVVFGVDGSINKVDENTILCAPRNLPVGGDINLGEDSDE